MNLKTWIGVVVALAVVVFFFWFGPEVRIPTSSKAQEGESATSSIRDELSISPDDHSFVEIESGLKIADVKIGTGEVIEEGNSVAVHYIGRFSDGTPFDSSIDRKEPLVFEFGAGQLIPGFERGLSGMRVGGIRRILIAPELAYGKKGVIAPDGTVIIPPDTTLMFDVLLVAVDQKR
jgi:peptidylprolyl isomerase